MFAKVQKEDEDRLQRAGKKRMRMLRHEVHIKRTGYAQLKVDLAILLLSLDVANVLRLRRHTPHNQWVR